MTDEVPKQLSPEDLESIGNGLLGIAHSLHQLHGPVITANLLTGLALSYLQSTQTPWRVAKLLKKLSVKAAKDCSA